MSKKNKDQQSCPVKVRASIGGQALIEGIMMRGPEKIAMAVRDPNGMMILEKWDIEKSKLPKFFKLPIIRGMFNFIGSMKMGYKCLMRSAEIAIPEDEIEAERRAKEEKKALRAKKKAEKKGIVEDVNADTTDMTDRSAEAVTCDEATTDTAEENVTNEQKAEEKAEKKNDMGVLMTFIMIISVVLGVGLALVLFFLLPAYIYKWCAAAVPFLAPEDPALNSLVKSVFEGLLKIILIVAYMSAVTLMKDIKRTFQYHGAEHKTIFCYESGKPLTVENVRGERRFHPRCGTSFLILMLLVSIFVSFFIDPLFILITGAVPHTVIRVLLKLLLLPITMGIGYELIKISGKYNNLFTRIISAPGMWLQHITVLEPDDGMIECAIAAFVEVIPESDKDQVAREEENSGE